MGQIAKRAKSSVCPRKYSSIPNWNNPKAYQYRFNKATRRTFTDEVKQKSAKLPGPHSYDSAHILKPKIHGTYTW